jgi:hypothetical protein
MLSNEKIFKASGTYWGGGKGSRKGSGKAFESVNGVFNICLYNILIIFIEDRSSK